MIPKLKTPYKLREFLTLQDPKVKNASFILERKLPPDHPVKTGGVLTRAQSRRRQEAVSEREVPNKGDELKRKRKRFEKEEKITTKKRKSQIPSTRKDTFSENQEAKKYQRISRKRKRKTFKDI